MMSASGGSKYINSTHITRSVSIANPAKVKISTFNKSPKIRRT